MGAEQTNSGLKPARGGLALGILATLAVLAALYVAAPIILPILFALVLNLLLTPAKRLLTRRLRLPNALAALLLILLLFAVFSLVAAALSVPASNWIAKIPESLPKLQERFAWVGPLLDQGRHGLEQLEGFFGGGGSAADPSATTTMRPSSGFGGVGVSVLTRTGAALGSGLTLLVTLFFLLASGGSLLRRLVEVTPNWADKRAVVEIADEIERNVSRYLLTITVMNLLVGLANGLQMWALGMPNPMLWGTLAFLLNYVPILGPLTGVVVFFFVGVFSGGSLGSALLPPAIYLVIHVIEGETVTPMLLARRFTLNPVLVIVSLFFWHWMWGVAGAFLAVPLLAIAKIVCDRVPALQLIGHLLGGARVEPSEPARKALPSKA